MTSLLAGQGRDAVSLLLVGDELLLGHVVDTNAAWLGRRLDESGLRAVSAAHAPDDVEALAEGVRRGLADAPTVLVTGGLGPTSDDVTREALARLAGVPLRRDPLLEAAVREWFAARDRPVPPGALRMAELPAGAQGIGNGRGSAPGVRLALGDAVVYAVPGVPAEMRAMVEADVLPDLLARAAPLPATETRTLLVTGLGESEVAARLAPLEAVLPGAGAGVAYLAAPGEITVRLRVVGPQPVAVQATVDALAQQARRLLGEHVAAEGGRSLAAVVAARLAAAGATVAAAESLTGGLVGAELAGVPGASAVYRGAVVAYQPDVKITLLGVTAEDLDAHGAVDPRTAAAMAHGVRRRLSATFGVSTTGVAGPDLAEGHPPGTVHVAAAWEGGEHVISRWVPGDRAAVRRHAVVLALDLLRRGISADHGGATLG